MLSDEEKRTQADIREAYRWVYRVTEEAGAMLTDATRLMIDRGLEDADGLKSYYGQKVPPDSWPYVFYLARVYSQPEESVSGTAAFLAVSLGSARLDFEARLFAGALRWIGEDAQVTHSPIYAGVIEHKNYGRFSVSGNGLFRAEPNAVGRANHKGVEELRWFSAPLAWVSTPERLAQIVDATVGLRTGAEELARALIANVVTPAA